MTDAATATATDTDSAELNPGDKGQLFAMLAARLAIGGLALFAPRLMSRLLFFPQEHVSPGFVMVGRLFGIRNILLGLATAAQLGDAEALRRALIVNAAVDAADAAVIIVPIARREGIDAAALSCLGLASTVTLGWLRLLFRSGTGRR